jgi:hypothetical protein
MYSYCLQPASQPLHYSHAGLFAFCRAIAIEIKTERPMMHDDDDVVVLEQAAGCWGGGWLNTS